MWLQKAQSFFPGLSVRDLRVNPERGSMRGVPLSAGHIWTILSPPVRVSHDPGQRGAARELFSIMLQIEGSTTAVQWGNRARLRTGDLCVIDNRHPFELEVTEPISQILFVQMPRHWVLGRHPNLERHTAKPFDRAEAGTSLLRALLLNVAEVAPSLQEEQRGIALASVIQLVGAPRSVACGSVDEVSWRVRAALTYIDANLSDRTLDAERVSRAQGISRRRLDEIMSESIGVPVARQIWIRRLTQAANDLRDPRWAQRTVQQIAFAAGFESAAHFTRAFQQRYQCAPSDWRRRAGITGRHPKKASPV